MNISKYNFYLIVDVLQIVAAFFQND